MSERPWRIELLGTFRLARDCETIQRFRTRKTSALLAYLANAESRPQRREALIELVWPEEEEQAGRNQLRMALSNLRKSLERPEETAGTVVVADRANVQLNPDAYSTDKGDFEACLQRALHAKDDPARISLLTTAIEFYRGPFLPGFDDPWIIGERQRLEDAYLLALRRLIKLLAQAHQFDAAIAYAQQAIQTDPLREEAHRVLMRLYAATGRPHAALRQYRELEQIFARELATTPSASAQELAASLRAQSPQSGTPAVFPTQNSCAPDASGDVPISHQVTPPVASSFPSPLTRIFGIEDRVAAVREMLATPETRLVTLTGLGGFGKTRLALKVAQQIQDEGSMQVWVVPLAALSDVSLLVETIASALGITPTGPAPLQDQVVAVLAAQPSLLILDNFELLAEGGAVTVQAFLERTPGLTCLVTSRRRLRLSCEYEYAVKPLPIPSPESSLAELQQVPSLQIFVARAQAVSPEFQITSANAAAIAKLCQRLDGIPLAIELAATWAGMLTPAQMLSRLSSRRTLPTNLNADVPTRHTSLHAVLEGSYSLLSPPAQHTLACLSVFRGGWTLDAAEAVCEEPQALAHLTQLREGSWLTAAESGDEMRFFCLETIQEYGASHLSEAEAFQASRRHASYFLRLAEGAEAPLRGPDAPQWLRRLELEQENCRAALTWFLSHPGEDADGLRLASAIWRFWYLRGYFAEGLRWLRDSLQRYPDAPGVLRAKAVRVAGNIASLQRDHLTARDFYLDSLALLHETNDTSGTVACLCALGNVANDLGDHSVARRYFEDALHLCQGPDNPRVEAILLSNLSSTISRLGDYATARSLEEENLRRFRAVGSQENIIISLNNLADTVLRQSDFHTALSLLLEALKLEQQLPAPAYLAQTFAGFATAAGLLQKFECATILYGAYEALQERMKMAMPAYAIDEYERELARLKEALGDESFASAWTRGRAFDTEQAIAFALCAFAS